jgi:hypothetical protein
MLCLNSFSITTTKEPSHIKYIYIKCEPSYRYGLIRNVASSVLRVFIIFVPVSTDDQTPEGLYSHKIKTFEWNSNPRSRSLNGQNPYEN